MLLSPRKKCKSKGYMSSKHALALPKVEQVCVPCEALHPADRALKSNHTIALADPRVRTCFTCGGMESGLIECQTCDEFTCAACLTHCLHCFSKGCGSCAKEVDCSSCGYVCCENCFGKGTCGVCGSAICYRCTSLNSDDCVTKCDSCADA